MGGGDVHALSSSEMTFEAEARSPNSGSREMVVVQGSRLPPPRLVKSGRAVSECPFGCPAAPVGYLGRLNDHLRRLLMYAAVGER